MNTRFEQLIEEEKHLSTKGRLHLVGLFGNPEKFLRVVRDYEVVSYTVPFGDMFGAILEAGYLLALLEHEIELDESLIREKEETI